MALKFVSTEDTSIDLTERSGPRVSLLIRSSDNLSWRLIRDDGKVEQGHGDPVLSPGEIVLSDLSFREWQEMRSKSVIRPDEFLRLPMREIRDEWGLKEETGAETVRHLAPLLRRALMILETVAGDSGLASDFAGAFKELRLATWFSHEVVEPTGWRGVDEGVSRNLSIALSSAWSAGVLARAAATAPPREVFTFRRPGVSILRDFVAAPMPAGDWRAISHVSRTDLDEIIALKLPTLARVHWSPAPRKGVSANVMSEVLRYLGWQNPREASRDWAPLEEILILKRIVDVNVDLAFIAERWTSSALHDAFIEPLCRFGLYWTADLAAQNLLVSLTGRNKTPISPSALSVWTTARDRIIGSSLASRFTEAGFPVIFYYLGGVRVHCPPARIEEAIALAWRLGLTPPLAVSAQDGPKQRVVDDKLDGVGWGGDADLLPYATLRANGEFDALLAADEIEIGDET